MADIAAIVLAAGTSSRYRAEGGVEASKLVADFRGQPLVRLAVRAALESRARPVIVVTGHASGEVEAALAGLDVTFAHNPLFSTGMASSLKTGVAAASPEARGAIVVLGDMPQITPGIIDAVIGAFLESDGVLAAAPSFSGRRGNPVLLGRRLFPDIAKLEGDEGARGLLNRLAPDQIASVAFDRDAVTVDVDTPADLMAAKTPTS